jgi:hypothetical protein
MLAEEDHFVRKKPQRMFQQLKIRDTSVEFDATATRAMYAEVTGTIDLCKCDYCVNYRTVRTIIYPPEFLAVLSELGIDYKKETELAHLADEGYDRSYGQPVFGHFAFVGRVVGESPSPNHDAKGPFDFWVNSGGHPTTSATFGNEMRMLDLNFFVAEVPKSREG